MRDRQEIARSAAAALEAFGGAGAGERPAVIGFDAFIDSIIDVVDRRHSMEPGAYDRIETIAQFAARVGSAAGKSTNLELVVKERRFGGNGPLMAGAMGRLGTPVTYIGAVGAPGDRAEVHPIYADFAARCERVVPLAPPATTDALEFDDGKVMLGQPANVQQVTWARVKEAMGVDALVSAFERAHLIGIVNWVMLGGVEGIWEGLLGEVLPALRDTHRRRIFIDLCDPAKRTDADIVRALGLIRRLDGLVPVTLGLNLAESQRIARVVGAAPFDESHNLPMGQAVRHTAESIRTTLGIDCVVVHPRQGAAASNGAGESAWFEGPFTSSPKLSTGAGDHFNGGFSFGQIAGLPLAECLAAGSGVSGAYVRDAQSPTLSRLVGFLSDLPGPG